MEIEELTDVQDNSDLGFYAIGHQPIEDFIREILSGWDVPIEAEEVQHEYWRDVPLEEFPEEIRCVKVQAEDAGAYPVTVVYL